MTESTPSHPVDRWPWPAGAAYALVGVLWLGGGLFVDPRSWGFHAYAFLPRAAWSVAAVAFAALAAPPAARALGRGVELVGRSVLSRFWVVLGLSGLAAAAFALGRLEFQFLGDGALWVRMLESRQPFHYFEPLAAAFVRGVARALDEARAHEMAGFSSVALGPLYVVLTATLARTLWVEPLPRGAGWLLLLLHPTLLLFFGYVESYPLLWVLEVGLALTLVLAAERRLPVAVPVVVAGLAIAAHLVAAAWLPALVVLMVVRHRRSRPSPARPSPARSGRGARAAEPPQVPGSGRAIGLGLALSAVSLGLAVGLMQAVEASPRQLVTELGQERGVGSFDVRRVVSTAHAIDLANLFLLTLGPAAVLLLGARRWRLPRESLAGRWGPLAAMLPGPLLFCLVVHPRLGGARDWDLLSLFHLPLLLLVVEAWRIGNTASQRHRRTVVGWSVGLAAFVLAGWLGVQLDTPRAAARMEVLQQPYGTFSRFAQSYANEALGLYYEKIEDQERAYAAWFRATETRPRSSRYQNNLGTASLRLGRIEEAHAAFRRAYELGMREWFVLYNLCGCEIQLGSVEKALEYAEEFVTRWPEMWQAWARRAEALYLLGRSQKALRDVSEALRRGERPEVQYLRGQILYREGRFEEARSAWLRTLQLQASFTPAQEALRTLPRPATQRPGP